MDTPQAVNLSDEQKQAAASAYIAAAERNDTRTMEELKEPDSVVWHSYDEVDVPGSRSSKSLQWLFRFAPDLAFADQQVRTTPDGFVLQWTMTGSAADGSTFRAPSCLVVILSEEGRITRVEEYIDPAPLAVLRN